MLGRTECRATHAEFFLSIIGAIHYVHGTLFFSLLISTVQISGNIPYYRSFLIAAA